MTEHRGLDLVALRKFLSESNVPLDGELRADLISGGKSNLTYAIFDDSSRWVLRRPPTAGLTPSAHDVPGSSASPRRCRAPTSRWPPPSRCARTTVSWARRSPWWNT